MSDGPGAGAAPGSGWRPGRRDALLALALAAAGVAVGRRLGIGRPARAELATRTRMAMGTLVEISVPAAASFDDVPFDAAFDEFARLERVFSPHRQTGGPATPAERGEIDEVLALGRRVAAETRGALDLRIRDWIDLWGWEAEPRRPAGSEIDAVRRARAVRREEAVLSEYAFGAVAKGYAVDRALAVLRAGGAGRAMVNAGGEIGVIGDGWTVGIQHPRDAGGLIDRIRLDQGHALATSGDYQQYVVERGQRWHHLLSPATGLPASGCRSVSVCAPTCAEADIWATALFVSGPESALQLAAARPDIEVLLVDSADTVAHSAGWPSVDSPGRW